MADKCTQTIDTRGGNEKTYPIIRLAKPPKNNTAATNDISSLASPGLFEQAREGGRNKSKTFQGVDRQASLPSALLAESTRVNKLVKAPPSGMSKAVSMQPSGNQKSIKSKGEATASVSDAALKKAG